MTLREEHADLLAEITALREHVASLDRRIAELQAALAQANDQEAATSQILRVISRSPTDIQPVLDAVAESAARLCESLDANIFRRNGDRLVLAAHHGPIPVGPIGEFTIPLIRGTAAGRAVLDERAVHVADMQTEGNEFREGREIARGHDDRTILGVPLIREGRAIGVIVLRRTEAQLFTDRQVALLQTFADQAVIAIENVRLFKDLEARNRDLTEALEQQTATAEILAVISSSPTNIQPVLDAVAASAARVCGATDALIMRVEGHDMRRVAHFGSIPLVLSAVRRITSGSTAGRAVLECRPVHVHDILATDVARDYPESAPYAGSVWRTTLAVPLVRADVAIGAITIRRTEVRPFTDKQIKLLRTFADQAVIAIENVRLFTELEARNRELTEALAQQTATSEVLQAISQSPTEVQPVFETIVRNAVRLCGGVHGGVYRFDGQLVHSVAHDGYTHEDLESWRKTWPRPVTAASVACQAIRTKKLARIADIETAPELSDLSPEARANLRVRGSRSVVAVPIRRQDDVIGAISVTHGQVDGFSDAHVELLRTFADQAVIAIENVRLFNETKEALERQTATSEILQVISGSPTDVQPVFEAIAQSARRLCDGDFCAVTRYDGELLHLAAHAHVTAGGVDVMRQMFPVRPSRATVNGRTVLDKAVVHIPDAQADVDYAQQLSEANRARSLVGVPMLRDGQPLGGIGVGRFVSRPFSDHQIALLQTFADQAVIAIENVRLFKELQEKNRELTESNARVTEALDQQTATAEVLRVISSSPTDLQPVLDAVAESAARVCGADDAVVQRVENGVIYREAHFGTLRPTPGADVRQATRRFVVGRAILDCRTIHVHDIRDMLDEYPDSLRGVSTILVSPLVREGVAIGAIVMRRAQARPFSDKQVKLLETFADQAVIAIENVRLFKELEARTRELTRSVDQLTALGEVSRALSSTLDLETVLNTIVTRANQLAGTDGCSIYEYDETAELFRLRASSYADPQEAAILDPIGRATPIPRGQGVASRAASLRQPVQIPDIAVEASYESPIRQPLLQAGYRAILTVPLLLEDRVIGALGVSRKTPGEFAPEVIDLLRTFATQSALAIQNARLFREIADKSRQLEVASQHKSEFLANMSHELRTPLNAIIGFSEVLSERMFGDLNEKQEEYLKDIYASGTHLLSLINDILDLSKIEAGRMELELTEFDLPTAIDSAVSLVRERAGRRGITLQATVDERLGEVRADERKIRQVVLNLLSNAIKFTPEGGRIEVRAVPTDGSVDVSVSDTGVGIAPEDQEVVFEEFRQVGTSAAKQEGTGLGLALCRKFVELHGGKIWVRSEVGRASTFTFTIPVRRGE